MKKPKYEKPLVSDLSSIQTAYGSCGSGSGEMNIHQCQPTGGVAAWDCLTGSTILTNQTCRNGSDAGWSCGNGSYAG